MKTGWLFDVNIRYRSKNGPLPLTRGYWEGTGQISHISHGTIRGTPVSRPMVGVRGPLTLKVNSSFVLNVTRLVGPPEDDGYLSLLCSTLRVTFGLICLFVSFLWQNFKKWNRRVVLLINVATEGEILCDTEREYDQLSVYLLKSQRVVSL